MGRVTCRLSAILGEKRIRVTHLAQQTGISPGALRLLYYDRMKKIDLEILARLCQALNCQPGDLLVYVPDEEKNAP